MTLPVVANERSPRTKDGKYGRHAYAIVRVDDFIGDDAAIELRVTIKRVMRDADEADREVDRLNRLQDGDGVRYFKQTTRVEDSEDQDRSGPAGSIAVATNRMIEFDSGRTEEPISDKIRAKLENIRVPQYVYLPPPDGLGFPASRAYEVIAEHSRIHQINYYDMNVVIVLKRYSEYVDVVGVSDHMTYSSVLFGFRIFSDLCDESLDDLSPLELIKRISERFGFTMSVGSRQGKFFLESEFPIPRVLISGAPEGEIIHVERPSKAPMVVSFMFKSLPSDVRIALAFVIDTTKYWDWVKNHQTV